MYIQRGEKKCCTLILGRVPDPEQGAAGVTFAGPDAAVCENTTWASPRFSEAAGFRAVTTREDGRIRFKRKKREGKTPTHPHRQAQAAAGGKGAGDESAGVRLEDGNAAVRRMQQGRAHATPHPPRPPACDCERVCVARTWERAVRSVQCDLTGQASVKNSECR